MRISDWSSDVCSSDLFGSREGLIQAVHDMRVPAMEKARQERLAEIDRAGRTDLEALLGALLLPIIEVLPPDERRSFAKFMLRLLTLDDAEHPFLRSIEIGRASGRERVCQYVLISVVAGSLKKNKTLKEEQT